MKIYIAGRITGNPYYKAEFKETKAVLQEAGHTVLNPAELPEGMKPADYMRICFAMLESADVVLFQHGWQESKGAKLEYDYAKYIGKKNIVINASLGNYKDKIKSIAVMMRWMMDEDLPNG